jgi:hypothetical protein
MKKPKPKQRKIPKPRPALRCQYIEASLLNGEKLEFCEQQCGRAATWDVVYTYDPTVLSDNGECDWIYLCTECVRPFVLEKLAGR